MILSPVAAVVQTPYRVVAVERNVAFAGKLGQRITQTLTLERDGRTLKVEIGRAHTFCGRIIEFAVGDRVTLPHGVRGGLVLPDAIRRVRDGSVPR